MRKTPTIKCSYDFVNYLILGRLLDQPLATMCLSICSACIVTKLYVVLCQLWYY